MSRYLPPVHYDLMYKGPDGVWPAKVVQSDEDTDTLQLVVFGMGGVAAQLVDIVGAGAKRDEAATKAARAVDTWGSKTDAVTIATKTDKP